MYKEDTTIKLDEQEVSSEEVMTKFDKESKFRRLSGTPAKIVFVIAVAWSVFQLYTGLFGTFPSTLQRAQMCIRDRPTAKNSGTDKISPSASQHDSIVLACHQGQVPSGWLHFYLWPGI